MALVKLPFFYSFIPARCNCFWKKNKLSQENLFGWAMEERSGRPRERKRGKIKERKKKRSRNETWCERITDPVFFFLKNHNRDWWLELNQVSLEAILWKTVRFQTWLICILLLDCWTMASWEPVWKTDQLQSGRCYTSLVSFSVHRVPFDQC